MIYYMPPPCRTHIENRYCGTCNCRVRVHGGRGPRRRVTRLDRFRFVDFRIWKFVDKKNTELSGKVNQ